MKQTYDVDILGQKYIVKSAESKEHVNRVVQYLTEKMKDISRGQKGLSLHDISILTLLNVADEMFKNKAEMGRYKEQVVQKAKHMLHLIDSEV